jgi:pimeloyl-ACP methyl ester carboxylesterase
MKIETMKRCYPAMLVLAICLVPAAARAQGQPESAPCPVNIANIAACQVARLSTGAYVLSAMPKKWNGELVVFAHGGPHIVPPTASTSQTDLEKYAFVVRMGFAWVASTYRREGYGVRMAAEDTDDARKHFAEHIAKPKRVYLHGASYGGLVGAKLLETHAANYAGALFNGGAMGGALPNYEFRADLRVVYQHYCKNLPRADEPQYPLWIGLPADSKLTLKEIAARVNDCTGVSKPAAERTALQTQNLANILGVMRFPEAMLVRHMQGATYVLRELALFTKAKSDGVFSNRNVTYRGSSDDAALNRDVERFDADPAALAMLVNDGQPTGATPIPVVSIHSLNDPQAAVEAQYDYREVVRKAGHGERLVQAYTDEPAHTAQSWPELGAAFDGLLQWVSTGRKPSLFSIMATCERARVMFEGPCRYRPAFEPKPYATRYARAAVKQ